MKLLDDSEIRDALLDGGTAAVAGSPMLCRRQRLAPEVGTT